ncbi:germ cell nuclear acidic protein isoform X2 [Notamacropus eugenii]|uniref:germ cell nuclear acidic protein isoform X2 n=1 Tax=Notamacropus eugenii TaxID=9315 RepID=UPI003B671B72
MSCVFPPELSSDDDVSPKRKKRVRRRVLDSSSDEELELVLSQVKPPRISSSCSSSTKRNDECDEAGSSEDELVKGKGCGGKPQELSSDDDVPPKRKKRVRPRVLEFSSDEELELEKKTFETPSRDVPSSVQDSGTPTPGFSGTLRLVPTLSTPPVTSASYPDAPQSSRRGKLCRVAGCFLDELSDSTSDYVKYFHLKKEELTWKLYHFYNTTVFGKRLPDKMIINWNKKMRTTAGYCRFSGKEGTPRDARNVRIELSEKVCDSPDRLRDTLIHELCHVASWLFHGVRDCHGPFWKIYAHRSKVVHPELPMVKRCHTYEIHYKFIYECTRCKARVGRHSKSVNIQRVVCSVCRGSLVLLPPTQKAGTSGQTRPTPAASHPSVTEEEGVSLPYSTVALNNTETH